jgi:hypothetical protein
MYQRFPGGAAPAGEPAPANGLQPVPQSVLRAVQVMYAGLAASLLGIIIDMTTLSSTRSEIIKLNPSFTATQINNAEHVEVGLFIAGGLIGAALWLWMAQGCRAGKNWARITSTVFFGIDTVSQLVSLRSQSGDAARFYGLLVWAIGLVAIILLWQRSSSDYFRRVPR